MSRDYKPREQKAQNGNPFMTGLMIGFLMGVIASLVVIMFIKSKDSPFAVQSTNAPVNLADKIAKDTQANEKKVAETKKEEENKTHFDFYDILPEAENKVTPEKERKIVDQDTPVVAQQYFLQVGAFQTADEADALKAKLAIQGFEAVVQSASIPEKGVLHRVRVGPLQDLDEINQAKANLLINGFNAELIKVNN